jgi:anaerobic selenocysteine-containing dehydrogenase
MKAPLKKDALGQWVEVTWDEANANVLSDNEILDPVTGFPADRSIWRE